MKFQFKEGQWFDVRKLTDWQKQWCLDNLDWVSSCSKNQIKRDQYHLALYNTFGSTIKRFRTTKKTYVQPEDEITFNDFYWEDEEVSQESIFDNPRWVTLKHPAPKLTQGKDYKVVGFIGNGNLLKFTVVDDDGCESNNHFSLFHKVTPQDLLPEEGEESFDNLVFTQPLVFGASVPLKNLSDEQLMFIVDYFNLEQPSNHKTHFTCLSTTGERYFSSPVDGCRPCYNLSFNDIFKEAD